MMNDAFCAFGSQSHNVYACIKFCIYQYRVIIFKVDGKLVFHASLSKSEIISDIAALMLKSIRFFGFDVIDEACRTALRRAAFPHYPAKQYLFGVSTQPTVYDRDSL